MPRPPFHVSLPSSQYSPFRSFASFRSRASFPPLQEPPNASPRLLKDAARPAPEKILNPQALSRYGGVAAKRRSWCCWPPARARASGSDPKCIQPVPARPWPATPSTAFRRFSPSPRSASSATATTEVSAALGADNIYVLSDNPAGGTAFAAYEAFSVPDLLETNPCSSSPWAIASCPRSVFRRLCETHAAAGQRGGPDLPHRHLRAPRNRGKGRVLRGENGRVHAHLEERDILARYRTTRARQTLLDLTEGNCPLYSSVPRPCSGVCEALTNDNAQGQYYITDVIEAISREGGEIRTVTTTVADPEYDLLCSDVTRPMDLALLEGILSSSRGLLFPEEMEVEDAARAISADSPPPARPPPSPANCNRSSTRPALRRALRRHHGPSRSPRRFRPQRRARRQPSPGRHLDGGRHVPPSGGLPAYPVGPRRRLLPADHQLRVRPDQTQVVARLAGGRLEARLRPPRTRRIRQVSLQVHRDRPRLPDHAQFTARHRHRRHRARSRRTAPAGAVAGAPVGFGGVRDDRHPRRRRHRLVALPLAVGSAHDPAGAQGRDQAERGRSVDQVAACARSPATAPAGA